MSTRRLDRYSALSFQFLEPRFEGLPQKVLILRYLPQYHLHFDFRNRPDTIHFYVRESGQMTTEIYQTSPIIWPLRMQR